MTNRQLEIDQRRARIAAGKIGDANIAADLVQYGHGNGDGLHIALAQLLWPAAFSFFDALHHHRDVDGLPFPIDVYKLAREGDSTAVATWATAELAKRQGMGWGHYPIVASWEGQPLGSKITYSANKKNDKGRVRRTIIPTCSAHNAIIRKCNQILVEAEEQRLYLLETNTQDAKRIKDRWKRRPSVRYFSIPQALGRVVMVHSEEKEGGNELGAMCNEYGKAELYALVKGWVDNKPEAARAGMSSGWGKHYKFTSRVSEEGRAKMASNARLTLNSRETGKVISDCLNSTLGEDGRGLDYIEQATPEVETLIEQGMVSPLTEKQLGNLMAIDSDNSPISAITTDTNTIALISENEGAADASTLSAKPPKQRNKPLGEAVGDRLQAMWEQIAAEQVREVQPC